MSKSARGLKGRRQAGAVGTERSEPCKTPTAEGGCAQNKSLYVSPLFPFLNPSFYLRGDRRRLRREVGRRVGFRGVAYWYRNAM